MHFHDVPRSSSIAFPIFHPQAIHAFEFLGVVGDEDQVERESLAAELQIIGADLHTGFLKRVTDFRRFDGGIPIEWQQVEWLQKGGDFPPLPFSGSLQRKTPAYNSKMLTIDTAQSSGLQASRA